MAEMVEADCADTPAAGNRAADELVLQAAD